jgi:hypothetical protein
MSRHAALHSEPNLHHQYPGITRVLADLEKENYRLKKLLPKPQDAVLPFVLTSSVEFSEAGTYCSYVAKSENYTRVVRMQRAISPEGLAQSNTRTGVWFGVESRIDAQGREWTRSIGNHVQDDFGMLVPVPAPMNSLKLVQS